MSNIKTAFADIVQLATETAFRLDMQLMNAVDVIAQELSRGAKILSAGNGGSATQAAHFVAEMIGKLKRDRPGIRAVHIGANVGTLTALGNDYDYHDAFSREIEALGNVGDVILLLSTSGESKSIVGAAKVAHLQGMRVIALTGHNAHAELSKDIHLSVPSTDTQRIQEIHMILLHIIAQGIEDRLYG